MATDPYEIRFYRGDYYPKIITFTDKDTGQPISLAGMTLTLTVNKEQNPTTTDNQLFQIVGDIVDEANGKASFTPAPTDNDLDRGKYYYDVSASTATTKRTLVKGSWCIDMDIGKD